MSQPVVALLPGLGGIVAVLTVWLSRSKSPSRHGAGLWFYLGLWRVLRGANPREVPDILHAYGRALSGTPANDDVSEDG